MTITADRAPDPRDLPLERGRCSSVRPSRRAIRPISVAMPGRGHDGPPAPAVTAVPLNTMLTRSPRPAGRGQRRDVLEHRLALAGQRGLRHHQRGRLDSRASALTASPSASSSTSPGTTSAAGCALAPVAHDAGRRRGHPLQRGDRLLGPGLLHVAEHGVEDDDHRDHDRLERHPVRALGDPGDERQPPPRAAGRSAGRRTGAGTLRHAGTAGRVSAFGPVALRAAARLDRRSGPVRRRCPRRRGDLAALRHQGSLLPPRPPPHRVDHVPCDAHRAASASVRTITTRRPPCTAREQRGDSGAGWPRRTRSSVTTLLVLITSLVVGSTSGQRPTSRSIRTSGLFRTVDRPALPVPCSSPLPEPLLAPPALRGWWRRRRPPPGPAGGRAVPAQVGLQVVDPVQRGRSRSRPVGSSWTAWSIG